MRVNSLPRLRMVQLTAGPSMKKTSSATSVTLSSADQFLGMLPSVCRCRGGSTFVLGCASGTPDHLILGEGPGPAVLVIPGRGIQAPFPRCPGLDFTWGKTFAKVITASFLRSSIGRAFD